MHAAPQLPSAAPARRNSPFLETAFSIGAQLCRDALWDGRRCTWLGPSSELVDGEWKVIPRTYGPEVYHGTAGNVLFLSRLYRLTDEPLLRAVAQGAARQALSRLEAVEPAMRVGFYTGWAGIAYACMELGEATEDERWITEGRKIFHAMGEESLEDQAIDVVAGLAGAIGALLSVHQRPARDGERLLDLAVRLGEVLLNKAVQRDRGWSWDGMAGMAQEHLNGFSHGVAGIAWSLLELYRATADDRFKEAALEGFRYERSWYSPQHENWPDLRDPETMQAPVNPNADGFTLTYPLLWCHGAPGIGLSRLRACEILGDEILGDGILRAEAEAALRSTTRDLLSPNSGTGNYSLCHGLAGNAELLIYASQILNQPSLRQAAEQIGWQGIASHERPGVPWTSGMLEAKEAPNLMLGKTGTGYFYLRLYDPEAVPSLLILPQDGEASAVASDRAPGQDRAASGLRAEARSSAA